MRCSTKKAFVFKLTRHKINNQSINKSIIHSAGWNIFMTFRKKNNFDVVKTQILAL